MITELQGSPLLGLGATHPLDYRSESCSPREILFADPTVAGYETLIASTPPELQIVVLDPNRDAISQISHILSHQEQPLDALHILSHAQPGILHLGSTPLSAENLPKVEISQWAKALTPDADILLYGCNLAADEGALLHRFAALTGADIAASDNLTGNAALGGDWTLEVSTGPVAAQIPFSAQAIGSYSGVLAPTELFISEYVEGSGNNKALEFYNGTGNTIDLAAGNYSVFFSFNGGATTKSFNLTGTVAPGDVYVFALNNNTDSAIIAQADQLDTNQFNWFSGNDAIVLFKNTAVIDSIGQLGVDPGSAWTGGGVSTQNRTLRRKLSVTAGDTNPNDAFNPSIEWVGYAQNTFGGLGSHNQAPQISISSGNLNYTENDGFALLNTSATASDADLTNFNGGTLTVNFTTGATTDDILMIRNQGTGPGEISIAASAINYSGIPIGTFTGGTQGNPLTINFNTNSADNAAVAALMQNIIYNNISENPSPGTRTVQFQLADALGAASLPATKTIDLTAANDSPIITVPGTLSVAEDMPIVLSGVTIADPDAAYNNLSVTLTVNHGNLTVNSGVTGGVAAANITANGTNIVTLMGTVSEINHTLADATGLTYQGLSNFYGIDNLTIVANDGAITDTKVINIMIDSVNDAPVLTLPSSQIANQSVSLPIPGITVADVDAASGILAVSLSANNGYITLNNLANLTLINGDGIGDAAMTFRGSLSDINNALNNLIYQGDANYSGADTINIAVNDLGNTGAGGSLSAERNIAVTVSPKGVLTLGEHSASQISDQFFTASTSVPDMTVWHRFRLSAANEAIIINNLTVGVTTTGIANSSISDLQLIADVNHNGVYDTGDVPVGTVETPLDMADGITLSNFTVPVGDNDYLLVGGVNNLQDGFTLSLALENGDIVAANANSISISADGTVGTAQHIADGIVPDTNNPPTDTNNPPTDTNNPPTDTSNPPTDTNNPPTDTNNPPTDTNNPPTDTSNPPTDTSNPPTDTSNPPTDTSNPPTDTSNPPTDTSNPPTDTNNPPTDTSNPPTDTSNPPTDTNNPPTDTNNPPTDTNNPPTDTSNPPTDTNNPPTDTNNPPTDTNNPPTDTSNPPTDTNNPPTDTSNPPADGNTEPIDNSGNMPPEVPVVRSSDGSTLVLPPETEAAGVDVEYCLTIHIPEALDFPTMPDSDWMGNIVNGGEAEDVLMGGDGDDALLSGGGDDRIYGGEGSDRIDGGDGDDTMQGGMGRHIPSYQGDRDAIKGGLGNDRIYGNEDNDRLSGEEGNDTIYSGLGEDIAWGGPDRDLIYGDRGSDTLSGDVDNDSIYGGPSDPDLANEDKADYISGGTGDDFLNGNQGADTIGGGEGEDTLHGGKGNDFLAGDSGEDMLFGDNGDDILCGGDGDDTLIGGSGSDRFILSAVGGTDAITDFETGIDQLILAGNLTLAELSIQQQGGLTTISTNGKVIAIVLGVSSITRQDFRPIGS